MKPAKSNININTTKYILGRINIGLYFTDIVEENISHKVSIFIGSRGYGPLLCIRNIENSITMYNLI